MFVFVHCREGNELWLVAVHISLCLILSPTHTHGFTAHSCESSFASFLKNLLSAKDKAVDDSVLDCVFLMQLCARGHVPDMCSSPASVAVLQALRRHHVAYTGYITNGINFAIAHLAGN